MKTPNILLRFALSLLGMLFCLSLAPAWAALDEPQWLMDLRAVYETDVAAIRSHYREKVTKTGAAYVAELQQLERTEQQAGHLDELLAAKKARELFTQTNDLLPTEMEPGKGTLAALQRKFYANRVALAKDELGEIVPVTKRYVELLQSKIKTLTQQGRIDEATVANGEKKRMEGLIEMFAADSTLETEPPATPTGVPRADLPTAKHPDDKIRVKVVFMGGAVRGVPLLCRPAPRADGDATSDENGWGSFPVDPKQKYEVHVISDKFNYKAIHTARPGHDYLLDLEVRPKGGGIVRGEGKGFTVPSLSPIRIASWWQAGDTVFGIFIHSDNKHARFTTAKVSTSHPKYPDETAIEYGKAFTVSENGKTFKLLIVKLTDSESYVSYEPVN